MSEKAANVQRKTLEDLQKAWRTVDKDHFNILQESLDQEFCTVLSFF